MASAFVNFLKNYFGVFVKATPYSLYVLSILLLTFMLNQLDRFVLPITAVESSQDLKFGTQGCLSLKNASKSDGALCGKARSNQTLCNSLISNVTDSPICKYDYNGQGTEYQVINGPVFILVFTVMGIIVSMFADKFHKYRTYILAGSLAFWSLMTFLSGFVTQYWQLALFRFGLGLGQAGCNPIATSLIADYFAAELRGSALGVYNWGIYTGYSLSFAIGNSILTAHGWRWVYRICGIPGFLVAAVLIFTVKPKEKPVQASTSEENSQNVNRPPTNNANFQLLRAVVLEFFKPSIILLCLAGSIRNAAGYVWAANNNQYYKSSLMNQTPEQITAYLGWIPIIFGIIGSFVGGFVSDLVSKKADPSKRIWVLVISQISAAPFVAGVLFFSAPYSYWFLIPTYIIGEMWIGVCLSVLVELVPEKLRITGVGVYFFIISNIGGNMSLLVPPTQRALESLFDIGVDEALRGALYIYYPGLYVLGSALFLLTLFVLKRDINRIAQNKKKTSDSALLDNGSEKKESVHENEAFDQKEDNASEHF